MTSMMVGNMDSGSGSSDKKETKKDGEVKVMQMMTNMFSTMASNDLEALKKYHRDSNSNGAYYIIWAFVSERQFRIRSMP